MKTSNITEGLEYKDLVDLVRPTIHIDEFASKMGDDDDITVISFYIRDQSAGNDLVSFFENGYPFILDAELSEGEISPNRYLVYVEVKRRRALADQIIELIKDLESLTELKISDWKMFYENNYYPLSKKMIENIVPLSPHLYRLKHDAKLNEMRSIAGIPVKVDKVTDPDLIAMQRIARIK